MLKQKYLAVVPKKEVKANIRNKKIHDLKREVLSQMLDYLA